VPSDPVFLSRLQFAFVISFHIIFPAFTIGLAAWLATIEGVGLATGNPVYPAGVRFLAQDLRALGRLWADMKLSWRPRTPAIPPVPAVRPTVAVRPKRPANRGAAKTRRAPFPKAAFNWRSGYPMASPPRGAWLRDTHAASN
jgi:Cytochrome bd terminal oxidase subunit I